MIVRDKTPSKLLVNTDSLKAVILENERQKSLQTDYENSRNIFLALLGIPISCLLTLIPSWDSWKMWLIITILIIAIFSSLVTIGFFIRMLIAKNHKGAKKLDSLEKIIINSTKDEILYTALVIICFQKAKSGEVKFLTEKDGNFLIHCAMDPNLTAKQQDSLIINYLATTYNVQKKHVISVSPLSSEPFFSIKPVNQETRQNGFILFQVKLKKNAKQQLLNHPDLLPKSIREMEELPDLMGRNQDVVMALNDRKTKIVDSFEDLYGSLHIIWNITKECPYNCAICATSDGTRPELSTEDKLKVLNSIVSAKGKISTLDFAGGDPMYKSEIRTLIVQAINSLGDDHISITTTGRGIQAADNISEDEISKLLRKCEITIDASHENLAQLSQETPFSRNSPEYCSHNLNQIQDVAENLKMLVINIPLLDDDLSDEEIDVLIAKLSKLKKDYPEIQIEAQIIRLMPVGAFNDHYTDIEKYKAYNPVKIAKKIYTHIESLGISCRYHCSLRVLPELNTGETRCHMLNKKIGIDCAGNVFACTWGAYLRSPTSSDITQNPFYLGNLVSSSLKDILRGQGTLTSAYKRISRDISNRVSKPYCEAVSWLFQKELDKCSDPLSK